MTVEVMSRDLRYSGKPGRSFRKSKEDLALFESMINDLPDTNDLDSCLADVEPDSLTADQLLKKDVSDSDAEKNDDDWLVPTPEASVSPQSHPSNLIISRNLSAIKTTRSATLDHQPARASATPQRNPSPRVYKGTPQESKVSPSKIPRFNAPSSSAARSIPTLVRKSSPAPTRIPRAASSPRASLPSPVLIPRASSSPRVSAIPRASSSPRVSAIPRASSSPRTNPPSTSAIRPPSPKSKWSTSTKSTIPSTLASSRGSSFSPRVTTSRTSTSTIASTKGRKPSLMSSPSKSCASLPGSQPGSARSVKSVSSSQKKETSAAKASFLAALEFDLSETPSNLRTDPFTKRAGSHHARSLSRSYDGPSHSESDPLSTFQDYFASNLSRSQDRGAFQHPSSIKASTSESDADHSTFVPSKIPSYGDRAGVGRRTLTKPDHDDCDEEAARNRFGYGSKVTSNSGGSSTVKRVQMGFTLKREDVIVAATDHHADADAVADTSALMLIDTKAAASNMEMAIPHLATTAMISHVEEQGPVKVYQGLGDMEDMEDMGGNWCCGMADKYRGLCKQHECVIFNNFHTALVLKSPEVTATPCTQDHQSEKRPAGSESDAEEEEDSLATGSEHSVDHQFQERDNSTDLSCQPIAEFLQQSDHDADAAPRSLTASGSDHLADECKPGRRSKLLGEKLGEANSAGKRINGSLHSKWDVEMIITSDTCSRPRPLGKPPDFFDVTKRNVEDGGVVAAISSVSKCVTSSASECGDVDEQRGGNLTTTTTFNSSSSPVQPDLHRSASMNGSHVSHSDDEEDEEDEEAMLSESESDIGSKSNLASNNSYLDGHDESDHESSPDDGSSPRELMSQFSRASSTKSNVRRFFLSSATSIDLTRSIDTTCSTQCPYEYNIWEEENEEEPRYNIDVGDSNQTTSLADDDTVPPPIVEEEEEPPPPSPSPAPPPQASTSPYDYGLEKLAGYIRSASANARKRRASMASASSESDSKTSLSRESSFDYFVDFFEAQTNLDPEARAVADLLVSAHVEAKRLEYEPRSSSSGGDSSGSGGNVKRVMSSSVTLNLSDVVEVGSSWESNKSVQTLSEEKSGDGVEQIMESSATSLASGLDKHFSSFKFGQKKYPAGEFESITTLEVVPESPPPSHSARFNDLTIPSPSPLCQKFLKEIEEQRNLCEGIALGGLKSGAPLESVVRKSVELQARYDPKLEEEDDGVHAPPASPSTHDQLPIKSTQSISPGRSISNSSSANIVIASTDSSSTEMIRQVVIVEGAKSSNLEVDVIEVEKGKKLENENVGRKMGGDEDEEVDSEIEIEKAVVEEQVLRPPVPKMMTKAPGSEEMPVKVITATSTSPTKRAAEQQATDNDKTCGCTIL